MSESPLTMPNTRIFLKWQFLSIKNKRNLNDDAKCRTIEAQKTESLTIKGFLGSFRVILVLVRMNKDGHLKLR